MSSDPRSLVLYLHVHQPWRIRQYGIFDVSARHDYFINSPAPGQDNELLFHKVAQASYWPMNRSLESLLSRYPEFKISLSITGTFLDQAERFDSRLLESFKRLVSTGRVEILAETYHHSLAFFFNHAEFEAQVQKHQQKIKDVFGVAPRVFRNTELAYNNDLAKWAESAGYKGILAEGWDPVLAWRSPNFVYQPAETKNISLLLKNYRLSDDIAFRFSDQSWPGWPLDATKYADWLEESTTTAPLVNLFMDYESFGEHQKADTGIFQFFSSLVDEWTIRGGSFKTIDEAVDAYQPQGEISVPHTTTWADSERDLSAWIGNDMQQEAMRHLYSLADAVLSSGNEELIEDWRRLQTADHVYYMSTKWAKDGDIHGYFSPYDSPYDAFLYFMNAVRDIQWRASVYEAT